MLRLDKKKIKKIGIHGFYGMGNLGDEAILQGIFKMLKNQGFEKKSICIFSPNPTRVKEAYGVKAVSSKSKILKLLWFLKDVDILFLGGGGLLKDYGDSSKSLFGWLRIITLAQKMGIKTATFCIGVDTVRFEESKKAIRSTLNKMDSISVRDRRSAEILKSLGVNKDIDIVGDPALVLVGDADMKKTSGSGLKNGKVVVCLRHWYDQGFYTKDQDQYDSFLKSVASALDYLIEKYHVGIKCIPLRTTDYDDDREVAKEIVVLMKNKKDVEMSDLVPSVDDFIQELVKADLVLGMRLHSLILASSVGTPVIAFEYMPKVKAFMEEIGMKEFSLSMDNLNPKEINLSIDKIDHEYEALSKKILERTKHLDERAN